MKEEELYTVVLVIPPGKVQVTFRFELFMVR